MRALWLFLFSVICFAFWYQISASRVPYEDAGKIPDHEYWYSLQWQDIKVGYIRESWKKNKEHFQWSQLLEIKGTARGKKFTRLSEEILRFSLDFPYQLIGGSSFVKTEQLKQQLFFTVREQRLYLNNGREKIVKPYLKKWDAQQLWGPQRKAANIAKQNPQVPNLLSKWNMNQLVVEDFDINFGDKDSAGNITAVSRQQGSSQNTLWQFDDFGTVLSKSMASSMTLKLSSQQQALKLSSTDVFLNSLLELDKPLGLVSDIGVLELELSGYPSELRNSENVRTIQNVSGGYLQIGLPGKAESSPLDSFLLQNTRYPSSARIERISKSLTQNKNSTFEKAQSIMTFVAEFIKDENIIVQRSVSEILDTARGDCTEHALLFVALSRAAGIPAREVNGLLYLGDEEQKYSAHVWAEVEIDGNWLSIDPTWQKVTLDPGYIRVYGDESSIETTLLAISGKTLHVKKLNYL